MYTTFVSSTSLMQLAVISKTLTNFLYAQNTQDERLVHQSAAADGSVSNKRAKRIQVVRPVPLKSHKVVMAREIPAPPNRISPQMTPV